MGCDIHLYAEVKIAGAWLLYTQPRMIRCYALFEKMAGVRGDVANAIAPPRGLPGDCSRMTRWAAEYDEAYAHSHSWLDAREIAELCTWGRKKLTPSRDRQALGYWDFEFETGAYLFGNSWEGFTRCPNDRPKMLQDIRWIFWFDN